MDLLAELLTCAQDFLLVHRHKAVVVDNNLTVANDGAGASSGGVEYEVADDVELGGRYPFVASQIPQYEICLFTHFDAADFLLKLKRLRSVDRCHVKRKRSRCPGGHLE